MKYKVNVAKLVAAIVVGIVFTAFIVVFVYANIEKEIVIDQTRYYDVTYVVDGDTLNVKVDDKVITVRVLGINTPETVDPRKPPECYGKEASDEAKRILKDQKVRLALNPNREVKDKYGRYLAYVYIENSVFFNEYMLENGFAREYTFGSPYSMQTDFRSIEKNAKGNSLGLWGECPTMK